MTLPDWYADQMELWWITFKYLEQQTGISAEDIGRFSIKRLGFSPSDLIRIFGLYGEDAFTVYGVDRYPRVYEGD